MAQKQGHLRLLAAHDVEGGGYAGSTADLYLEIQPGKGRVFLETFPLTRIDTQIATRTAQEIACNVVDYDCSQYDFIYTIKSQSSIIGGPSAGAATALLTISMLTGKDLRDDMAITGTINSHGLIGPVSGLKPKIEAASVSGITTVLVPQRFVKDTINATNTSDLVEYGKSLGVTVIEVTDINQAMYYMSGSYLEAENATIDIDTSYQETMRKLSDDLCSRSEKLLNETSPSSSKDLIEVSNQAKNLSSLGLGAYQKNDYYSSASFCFGANVKYLYLYLQQKNSNSEEYHKMANYVMTNILKLDAETDQKEIKTITDLESYMAVKERLEDAIRYVNISTSAKTDTDKFYALAYANERLYSAYSWYSFFDHRGKEFVINNALMKDSCQNVLLEVEERLQYLNLIFPDYPSDVSKELDEAYVELERGRYPLCLFKASKAKAEVDVPLNSMGVGLDNLKEYAQKKLTVAKSSIAHEASKGVFPILGYSYYEYARTLSVSDPYSSLLYSEYALELSNLDVYFHERGKAPALIQTDGDQQNVISFVIIFISGLGIGYIVAQLIRSRKEKELIIPISKKKNKKRVNNEQENKKNR